jgi:DNA helicase II / ATP-dependent DNA helicase PcrA
MTESVGASSGRERLDDLIERGRGAILARADTELPDAIWKGMIVRRHGAKRFLDSAAEAAVLPWLTETVVRVGSRSLLRFVATAVRDGIPVFGATPLAYPEFAGVAASSDSPWTLNTDEFLAREELAALLAAVCEWRDLQSPSLPGAQYLTLIETRMGEALAAAGVPADPQVRVEDYVVDFLVADRIVVECDGARYHDEQSDARRDAALQALGYSVLRFSGARIMSQANSCAFEVAAAVASMPTPEPLVDRNGLRQAQVDAIGHGDGPAMVIAPAGSGKTRVVEERIRRLVRQGVAPERICALSFTNAAVDEMRHRLGEHGAGVRFDTVHALASAICRERFGKRALCQASNPRQLTRSKLVGEILRPEEFRERSAVQLWVEALSEYRNSLRIPDLEHLPIEAADPELRFLDVHDGYQHALSKHAMTDFDGLILDAIQILTTNPETRLDWAGRHDYWIVDEFQDLPAGKMKLLRLLIAPHRNIFLVGDDDQVIYGFAGATPGGFLNLAESLPDIKEYVLDTNFRCPHELVVRSQWLISRNRHRKNKSIIAHQPIDPDARVIVSVESDYDQVAVKWVLAQIDAGTAPDQIALLFRVKHMAAPVECALRAAGLPFTPCARPDFYDLPIVKHARSWLRVVAGTATKEDYKRTLEFPSRYLTNEAKDWLVSSGAPEQRMETCVTDPSALPRSEKQSAPELAQRLQHYLKIVGRARLRTRPFDILAELQLEDAADAFPAPANTAPARISLAVLARVTSYFTTVAGFDRWVSLDSMDPDYAAPETLSEDGAATEWNPGAIVLSSVHAAKGREFRAVAVLGPLDGMPDRRAVTAEQLEEERRVAYVAVTRARERLLFCASSLYADELAKAPDGIEWLEYRADAFGAPRPSASRITPAD